MTFDRKDFSEAAAKKHAEKSRNMLPLLRTLQAAGTVMEQLLTDHDHWNRYMSYIQGLIENAKAAKEVAQAKQNDPAVWDPNELAKLKGDVLTADAMIRAWTIALELPRGIIDNAGDVQDILNRFEAKDETTQAPKP